MEFLKSNLYEIRKSTALHIYGGLISLAYLLNYAQWLKTGSPPLSYHMSPNSMCWTAFENCDWVKALSPTAMEALFHGFGVMAGLALAAFFLARSVGLGWFFLMVTLILKTFLSLQDLRLTGNIHYFLAMVTFAYLFIPNKIRVLRWLVLSYFVASGLLKLSPNWLSGDWFLSHLPIHVKLAEWLAGVAVLVELVAPMALWFRELRNFAIAILALFAYQGLLWFVGGYFEPSVTMALLMIFPLAFFEERKIEREYLYQSFIRPEPSRGWVILALLVFWTLQLLPYVPHTHIQKIKNVEQTLALAPLPVHEDCDLTTFLVYDQRLEEVHLAPPEGRGQEMACSPYLRFLDLKNLCGQHQTEAGFKTVMANLRVRGLKDATYKEVFQVEDFCDSKLTYRALTGAQSHGI